MPCDRLALQCPVKISEESRLDTEAGFGGGGHLGHNCGHRWLLRAVSLGEAGAVVSFGPGGRRGLLH